LKVYLEMVRLLLGKVWCYSHLGVRGELCAIAAGDRNVWGIDSGRSRARSCIPVEAGDEEGRNGVDEEGGKHFGDARWVCGGGKTIWVL
jgi:hypothetical protein